MAEQNRSLPGVQEAEKAEGGSVCALGFLLFLLFIPSGTLSLWDGAAHIQDRPDTPHPSLSCL
jgi:hypothetical protein